MNRFARNCRRKAVAGSGQRRICGLVLFFALAGLLCLPAAGQSTTAQPETSPWTQQTDQQPGGLAQQPGTGSSAAQPGTSTGADWTQESDQQTSGSTPQAGMQPGNQQSGSQQSGYQQGENQQTTELAGPQEIPAEQIIVILQQDPEALASMKNALAQQSGLDPSTIGDNAIFEQIAQDADLRSLAVQELTKRGYTLTPATRIPRNGAERLPGRSAATRTGRNPMTQPPPYEDQDDPQSRQRRSPYGNLPSLQELYSQFPASAAKLRRFGSETFLLGTGNATQLPMDMPVGPDYVLGPGDSLTLNLWGGQSGRLERPIDRQGQIALPEAGAVTIAGLTISQAQSTIQKALGAQFQNEHVELSLGRVRTVRVYVVGDVQRPGAYDVSSLSTPLNALYAAGGPTNRGSLRTLRHLRGALLVREMDLYDFLLHGVRSDSDRLQPGDTLLVPPVGAQVSVSGMVRRPAIYELKGEQSLSEVLELAGGVPVSASLKQIRVDRIEAHQRRTMLNLDLPAGSEAGTANLPGFRVQDGDGIVVSQILPFNEQAVFLDGHVFRPGKYPYREGMTVNDLLRSYQDVMPEPADHGEIVRLQAPDFRPETISFNLPDVMVGNDAIPLRPFDLVRIFGRYEIDSPKVSIEGEVIRPGQYPMSMGMTVADLVRMAGGFKRSAYRQEGDLSSYEVRDGQKVTLHHSVIALEKALGGDKGADEGLKPGDVVSVRQLSGWKDIGASVTVSGEVEHAGSFGIENGERLSSVLKRAGGFLPGAYPPGAVLERVQVRELGERTRQEMIRRIETTPLQFKPGLLSGQDQADVQQAAQQQRDQVLTALRNHPASGRLVINILPDIHAWENTPADIELRNGDTLTIPKRQSFVLVSGQVYNPAAITFIPGKDAAWYLRQAGGTTNAGDRGEVFIVRASGSVVGRRSGLLGGGILNTRMRPGDSIIVPEKAVGSQVWKNLISAAQIMSSVAITGAVTGIF
jgi:protein involved in polysaccharide export with SLBB domain